MLDIILNGAILESTKGDNAMKIKVEMDLGEDNRVVLNDISLTSDPVRPLAEGGFWKSRARQLEQYGLVVIKEHGIMEIITLTDAGRDALRQLTEAGI